MVCILLLVTLLKISPVLPIGQQDSSILTQCTTNNLGTFLVPQIIAILSIWLMKGPIFAIGNVTTITVLTMAQVVSLLMTFALAILVSTYLLVEVLHCDNKDTQEISTEVSTQHGESYTTTPSTGVRRGSVKSFSNLGKSPIVIQRRPKSTSSRGSRKIKPNGESEGLSPLELWFQQAHAPIIEGDTSNPHIIAKRALRDKVEITRDLLNSINALSMKFEVSEEEFNIIKSLSFTHFKFPLSSTEQSKLNKLIGPSKAEYKDRLPAVYTWTSTDGKMYVGGTPNVGRRIRKYMAPKAPKTGVGKIWRAKESLGLDNFTLGVGILPSGMREPRTMCFAAEQYWILALNPQYNDHKVAGGGGPTVQSLEALEAAIKVQGKPVYFYASDGNSLVHEFLSIYRVTASLPLSRDTILSHLGSPYIEDEPKLLYDQWIISHELAKDVDTTILSTDQLARLMMESRLNMDGLYDSDVLEQVLEKPFAYGKITQAKPLLATSPVTNETWYFRSYIQFNSFMEEAFGYKLSLNILYKVLDKQDKDGLFFGLHLEDPVSLDKAKEKYPSLITYHNTSLTDSKLYSHLQSTDKPKSYRDWVKRSQ